ncbi:MAG: DUF4124 domain-containing protein, partial [Proteobacteria bacterium]
MNYTTRVAGPIKCVSVVVVLLAIVPCGYAVNAYKCVDASGAIYFSDQQCRGSQQQTVIEIKPSPAAST